VETLLIDEWIRDLDVVPVLDEASLALVREKIRAIAAADEDVRARAALVASEMGTNMLRHARSGQIAVGPIVRGAHHGIEVKGADQGPGIADVAAALDAPSRQAGSLGVGVGAIRRLATEVDFDVRLGEGTRIEARIFDSAAPKGREIGVYGRAFPGEPVSGDGAAWRRIEGALVVTACDGLGHGRPARAAAAAAIQIFQQHAKGGVSDIIAACHAGISDTRGVVMAVVRLEDGGTAEIAAAGNVDVQICSPRNARRFGGTSAVVGARGRMVRPLAEKTTLAPDDLLVVVTDGIATRFALEEQLALLRMHPIVVAQRILEGHARPNDDALVLVVH
jgi:anti-sigma regulatory factor (Ser/Thr protein kinase)